MNIVPELLNRGKKVIAHGGDFRLRDAAQYEQFYRRPHQATTLLSKSVCGLPEWNREQIKTATLVANPGCYPTSAILPLAPLLFEIAALTDTSDHGEGILVKEGLATCF